MTYLGQQGDMPPTTERKPKMPSVNYWHDQHGTPPAGATTKHPNAVTKVPAPAPRQAKGLVKATPVKQPGTSMALPMGSPKQVPATGPGTPPKTPG